MSREGREAGGRMSREGGEAGGRMSREGGKEGGRTSCTSRYLLLSLHPLQGDRESWSEEEQRGGMGGAGGEGLGWK